MIIVVVGLILSLFIAGIAIWDISKISKLPDEAPQKDTQSTPITDILNDRRSESILEAISDGVVVVDQSGTITMLNSASCFLAGWDQKDALKISYQSVFDFCDDKGVPYDNSKNPFSILLKTGKTYRNDNITIITKGSGKHVSISISVSPLFNQRNLTGGVAILRDVSIQKRAERQRTEFISTASHEMRTPIATIEGYLALAMNAKVSNIDESARKYLLKAHESTQHLGQLFQDLLTSTKADDGRLINHPEIIEVGNFLEKLSEDLKFTASKKNLSVEYVVGISGARINSEVDAGSSRVVQPLYKISADPERLREVVANLFDNAVKYTEHGKISIGLTGDKDIVQIYVKDTGSGIAAEDIPHLFQKFYRIDNSSTRSVGGSGLGLFICRKIVEMYQGRIWVESQQGSGSTFFINLPRLKNSEEAVITAPSFTENKELE